LIGDVGWRVNNTVGPFFSLAALSQAGRRGVWVHDRRLVKHWVDKDVVGNMPRNFEIVLALSLSNDNLFPLLPRT
jgi:hypothetical protein